MDPAHLSLPRSVRSDSGWFLLFPKHHLIFLVLIYRTVSPQPRNNFDIRSIVLLYNFDNGDGIYQVHTYIPYIPAFIHSETGKFNISGLNVRGVGRNISVGGGRFKWNFAKGL